MKIGLGTYSFAGAVRRGELAPLDLIPRIARWGGEHVEISQHGFSLVDNDDLVAKLRAQAREYHIDISNYTIGADLLTETEKEVERIKKHVDIVARLGARFMRHDAANCLPEEAGDEAKFEAALAVVAPACREIADYAAKFDIVTSVENHGFLFQHSRRVHKLVETVDRPNFRTTLDVGNFVCVDENPLEAVSRNLDIASVIHFKDFHMRDSLALDTCFFRSAGGKFLRGAITGHGDIDLRAIAALILESGFDGYLSVEFEGLEPAAFGAWLSLSNVRALFGRPVFPKHFIE